MEKVRILGAGLSGLSAAINLALKGIPVEVLEKRPAVGGQINPNFQVLHAKGKTPKEYLSELNLTPDFRQLPLKKAFFSTRSRDFDFKLKRNVFFIQRGGSHSLEQGLYRQALGLGVEFKFNQLVPETEAHVVACGPSRVDAMAYGEVYENASFEEDHFFMMYDDRYSPKGWYLYAVPYDGKLAVINCVCQPHVGRVRELLGKALKEKEILRRSVRGSPVAYTGGFGNASIPSTAVRGGRFYVGEAAGFQDPFRGFGMRFALESGKFAADAIAHALDYDSIWRREFMPQFSLDYSRRFFLSLFGSGLVDVAYRGMKSGDAIDFVSGNVSGPFGNLLKHLFLHMELAKRKLTGFW